MLFSARTKELEGQLAALTIERDTLATANVDLTAANAQCATQHEADQLAVTEANTARDAAAGQVATLTSERDTAAAALAAEQASRESAISTEVTSRIASAGGAPIKRDPAASVDNAEGGKGRTAKTWGSSK